MDTLQAPWWPFLDVNQLRIEWFPWANADIQVILNFDPPFDNAFPTFKSVTECLCVHTYSFNMGGTCITKISKILCDDEINASLVWSVYLAQFPAESLPLFWEMHPSWSQMHSPTSVGSPKNGNVGVKLPIFPHKINRPNISLIKIGFKPLDFGGAHLDSLLPTEIY